MAVPLIITVIPNAGITMGNSIVDIKTNNARLPPDPPPTGKTNGIVPETVQIFFGDQQATNVQVISRGRVICRVPINGEGTVSVKIKNLDDSGVVIPGEEFTKADAYTYTRPDLTVESDFTRVIRTLIQDLKRQVIANVAMTTHTDYDDETGDFRNIAEDSKMPGLILVGPDVVENRFHSINSFRQIDSPSGVKITREPYTIDLQFQIIGVAELTFQLMELMHATMQYFHRNKYLRVLCDATDPSLGFVRYEIDFVEEGGEPNVTSRIGESNVRSFSGTMLIRGLDLEDFEGVSDDTVIDLTDRVQEVSVGVDPPVTIVEVATDDPIHPFNDDAIQDEAPEISKPAVTAAPETSKPIEMPTATVAPAAVEAVAAKTP